jgi:DNA repair protein RecO (recombination protein O)
MSPRTERTYRIQAVVLGHIEFGEADRILKLFTYERGKITAIAKGIRKIRSRKAGHLEPFTHVNLFLAKGKSLDIITQAETVTPYMRIRGDLNRIAYAAYVVEVLDRFTYEESQNIGIFKLLTNTLERLDKVENLETVIHHFEIRLLSLLGFKPQLFECVNCGKKIQEQDQFISSLVGGVLCPDCGGNGKDVWSIQKDVLRYLRHLQRSRWQQVEHVLIPEGVEKGLSQLFDRYFTYLLERKLNTTEFLRDIHTIPSEDE